MKDGEELVSFDVVSLFTSIPVDLAVHLAHNRLLNDTNLQDRTAIPVTFQYDHMHFRQIHGTAMGSPVSVIMANMVMEDLEERALTTLTNPPLFWKRFVDVQQHMYNRKLCKHADLFRTFKFN